MQDTTPHNAPHNALYLSPKELKERFIIPRSYITEMADWMNLSVSMAYQMLRQNRKPSVKTAIKLEQDTGVPTDVWMTDDLDTKAEIVYSKWYQRFTDINLSTDLSKIM